MKNTIENKKDYLLFFGNSPDLAKREAVFVAKRFLPSLIFNSMLTSQVALFNCGKESREELRLIADRLGGTVKIAEVIGQTVNLDLWFKNIENFLPGQINKKILFGLSGYSRRQIDISRLCLEIKKSPKSQKNSLRFILPKEGQTLSSAQIFHHRLDQWPNLEINIIGQKNEFLLAKTIWVQNPNDWSDRDWGIPVSDPKSGMLPPKLARMMINLSFKPSTRNHKQNTKYTIQNTVYDPFCGCGRVLLEAAALELDFLGSDINPTKVEATKKNLHWLRDHYHLKISDEEIETKIFPADAISTNYKLQTTNYIIVTEPNLGPPLRALPTVDRADKIADDLQGLYLKSISNLMPGAQSAVIVFPVWKTKEGKMIRLFEKIVDKISSFGYCLNRLGGYARPNSVIIREIIQINRK